MVTPIIQVVNPLTFTDINDSPDNPRLGLGYHQLYDPGKKVGLIAKLPDVTRVGDTVTLYWNEKMVYTDNLDQPTIDKGWLSFSVAPSDIPSMSGEVYYTLLDNVSGDLQTSPKRIIAVNRLVPGGLDPEIETAINEAMAPCTVSPNPVMNPAATVTVTVEKWDHQEVGDELTVMWNNLRVSHPKLTDSGLGPQSVIIPPEVLEAGGSSDKLLVNYEIRDIVDNYSLVSPGTYVRVEIDKDALLEPRVKEADLTTLVLDLAALGNGDAHVLIPRYIGNLKPYTVTLNWVGKTPTTEIPLTLPPERVTDPIFGDAIFVIPNAHLKLIAGGSAVVRYSLVPDGEPEKKSRTTTITLTGLPVPLAAPVVIEANGSVIDLDQIIGASATVNIAAYGGQTAGDKVVLNWKGTTKGGTPVNYTADYDVKAGDTVDILFNIPRAYIDPLESGTLKLSYQVVFNATGTTQNSAIAEYTVNAREVLPAPEVAGVTHGGVLNPASITDGVLVTIKYESMLDTDIIHLDWFGVPTTVLVQGDASKTVQVNIPNSVVAASLGGCRS